MHRLVTPEADRPSWPTLVGRRAAATTVVVVGDAMLDCWCYGHSERVCREAPAPVLQVLRRSYAPGGAGNTAANAAALGARAVLVAPVGEDRTATRLRDCLAETGVLDRTVPVPGRSTALKRRLLAGEHLLLREDHHATPAGLPAAAADRLVESLRAATDGSPDPVLLISDYGLGGVPEPVRRWLLANRRRFATIGLDARDPRPWRGLCPTILTPSLAEAARALSPTGGSGHGPGEPSAAAHARSLRESHRAAAVAVTLGPEGAVMVWPGGEHRTHADPAPESRSVGAGDVYLATATLAWAAGAPPVEVADLAQRAAQSTMAREGTCRYDAAWRDPSPRRPAGERKVVDLDGLLERVRRVRRAGGRIVFTNGCFDLLHPGHLHHLEQARQLGDLLVVALNSDRSVRRLKGPGRPVNPAGDRAAVLAGLAPVDVVVVFRADTAAELIDAVRPDVYVKGADHPPESVPEAPLVRRLGGVVVTLPYLPDRSTTGVVARIHTAAPANAPTAPAEGRATPGDGPAAPVGAAGGPAT